MNIDKMDQLSNEIKLGNSIVEEKVTKYMVSDLNDLIGELAANLKKYFIRKDYKYESKEVRLISFLRDSKLGYTDIAKELIAASIYITKETTINVLAMNIVSRLFDGSNESIKKYLRTASELTVLLAELDIIDITLHKLSTTVVCSLDVPSELQSIIAFSMCLPPMLCKPEHIYKNADSPYLELPSNVLLKPYYQHNKRLNLNTINRLNGIKLRLSTFMLTQKELPTGKLDTAVQKRYWKQYQKECKQLNKQYENRPFHLIWKYDARGRMYTTGYHITYHSHDYKRGSIELAKQEKLNDDGKYWMKIAIANYYGNGLDKKVYNKRIKWVDKKWNKLKKANYKKLVKMGVDKPFQMLAAIDALKNHKEPTGILTGLDASSSGSMIMGALTGCEKTLKATNVINTGKMIDPPMLMLKSLNKLTLCKGELDSLNVDRKTMKDVYMTTNYGSQAKPKELFGNGQLLKDYYKVIAKEVPGVSDMLTMFMRIIERKAVNYQWQLPDGHIAYVPIMRKEKLTIEIDELNGRKYTHYVVSNLPDDKDVSLSANYIHSFDAFVIRCMEERCNYTESRVKLQLAYVEKELRRKGKRVSYLGDDVNILYPFFNITKLDNLNFRYMTKATLQEVRRVLKTMLAYKPFEIMPIHDEIRCHPNNVKYLNNIYCDVLKMLGRHKILEKQTIEITLENGSRKIVKFPYDVEDGWKLIKNPEYALS